MIINKYYANGEYDDIYSNRDVATCLSKFQDLIDLSESRGYMLVKEVDKMPIMKAAWFASKEGGFEYSIALIDVLAAMREIKGTDFTSI